MQTTENMGVENVTPGRRDGKIWSDYSEPIRENSKNTVTLNNASDYRTNGLLSDYIGWIMD